MREGREGMGLGQTGLVQGALRGGADGGILQGQRDRQAESRAGAGEHTRPLELGNTVLSTG